ncbi:MULTISPECIES: response regulator [unclassified Colwellia]|uniref:response regulator n=1 Tax=unclassified Colwellia TaxID=196834 RepID=UPI0015F3E7CB|nr:MULTISPECIES: response regulator [unclassified Colwellia]MBA6349865.1 response regulator [Colwellia sp. BRX8-9]MBA6352767.1 response regulator [Colwellia sp. BRX9-1]MBA6381059.1 response regulator [Colwellia sp. BRX10-7]MBA6388891.1 response regulator [Colwellia sp. BRX10-2]MBA6403546.1 response regulator [Colwellia sp. BRX10-5]
MDNLKAISALMVEDNIDHAELMMDAFSDFNIKNTIAHVMDGEQAVAYLRNEAPFEDSSQFTRPDIVFLDIRMPRQGGIETLKIIKADPALSGIPVVMISTSSTAPEIEECYSLGASGYITKPLKFDDFVNKMKELNYYWVLTSELPS